MSNNNITTTTNNNITTNVNYNNKCKQQTTTNNIQQQCHTTNTNVIQQNNNSKNIILSIRLDEQLYNQYIELKQSRKIKKDSVLLRPVFQAGIITAKWLDEHGLLSINSFKLSKILSGLSIDEKAELFEILKKEFIV